MAVPLFLCSCESTKLVTRAVSYQSVRTEFHKTEVPDDATILVAYTITTEGKLVVTIKNMTSEVMIIDQTKTFFVNADGQSISYYDPTVRTTSTTSFSSGTAGASVNLGAVAGLFGVGGNVGNMLNGINVGGAETDGTSTTQTTLIADQPQYSLGPKGTGTLSKFFQMNGIGRSSAGNLTEGHHTYTLANSPLKYSVCITYSVDGGQSFDKIVTPLYVNAALSYPVVEHGRVNDALRNVLTNKQDALTEPLWLLYAVNNVSLDKDCLHSGSLIDFK